MRIRRRIVWGLLLLVVLGIAGTVGGFYAAGYRAYVIHTGSMEPTLMPGNLIIDRPADSHYQVDDIITFRHGPTDDLVTHRLTEITADGVHTKGDANRTADVWTIPDQYVEGVVRWHVPDLGYLVVFLKQPTGLVSVLLMLAALTLLWKLFFPAEQDKQEAVGDAGVPGDEPLDPDPNDAPVLATKASPALDRGRHRVDAEPDDEPLNGEGHDVGADLGAAREVVGARA